MDLNLPIKLSHAVQKALLENRAVVALESTVLTHGLPYPQNIETFCMLEATIEKEGATPATIVVIDGIAHIGLDERDVGMLEPILKSYSHQLVKLSMRDLPLAFMKHQTGGTTVSATMLLASMQKIQVFATGGIGGVHRDWHVIPDISMDIKALATIPVTVVSAGCKAILDIGATLECLESNAVPVLGWKTDSFPTFYSRTSTYTVDTIDSTQEFSQYYKQHIACFTNPTGILIANPIPVDAEIPFAEIEPTIKLAVSEADKQGIRGKRLTPFLLDFMAQSTAGKSIKANLALLENNARVAAQLAISLKD